MCFDMDCDMSLLCQGGFQKASRSSKNTCLLCMQASDGVPPSSAREGSKLPVSLVRRAAGSCQHCPTKDAGMLSLVGRQCLAHLSQICHLTEMCPCS